MTVDYSQCVPSNEIVVIDASQIKGLHNKPSKKELIKALNAAKRHQKDVYEDDEYSTGVCLGLPNNEAGEYLYKVIEKSIKCLAFVTTWLERNHPGVIDTSDTHQVHLYRLAWIEQMKELVNKGKL